MKQRVHFIINPISGIGKQKTVESLIQKSLSKQDFEIEVHYTNAPKHATELSKNAVFLKADIVVAVGGDGSVNEVSKGLLNSNTAMAILPAGSGNGLARHLSIPLKLAKALELLSAGKIKSIDSGTINGNHFINIAGVGFDAHIAHLFANYGKRGFISYIKLVGSQFFSYKEQDFKLEIDGKEWDKKAFLISIANGSQFGNNAVISPQSNIEDGLMEVCILQKIPIYAIPFFALKLFSQTAHQSKFLEIMPIKSAKLIGTSGEIHIDGDPINTGSELEIKINPKSLKVLVP